MKSILIAVLLVTLPVCAFERITLAHYKVYDLQKPFKVQCPPEWKDPLRSALDQISTALDGSLKWEFATVVSQHPIDLSVEDVNGWNHHLVYLEERPHPLPLLSVASGGMLPNGVAWIGIDSERVALAGGTYSVVLHELLHCFGLRHTAPMSHQYFDLPVMEEILQDWSQEALHYDDICGLRDIFGLSAIPNTLPYSMVFKEGRIELDMKGFSHWTAQIYINGHMWTRGLKGPDFIVDGRNRMLSRMRKGTIVEIESRGFKSTITFAGARVYLDPATGAKIKVKNAPKVKKGR